MVKNVSKNLDGDRTQIDQGQPGRFGVRIWIMLAIVLAGIALAVWRHAG